MAKASKGASKSKGTGKRTLIEPNGDKRYIRRNEKGQIKESDDQGRSLSQDIKKTAKKKVKAGEGDKGDQPKKKSAPTKKSAAPKKAATKKSAAPKKAATKKSAAPKKAATKKSAAPKKAARGKK